LFPVLIFLLTNNNRQFSHAGLGHFFTSPNQGKEYDFAFTAILYRTQKTASKPLLCDLGEQVRIRRPGIRTMVKIWSEKPTTPNMKNGEGGIRTRGRDKPYTAFPRLLDKPLRHLSGNYKLFNCYMVQVSFHYSSKKRDLQLKTPALIEFAARRFFHK
jgi:hypothetical protein